jgi:hypothetical protein
VSTATNERPLVCIEWIDSASTDAWMTIADASDQIALHPVWTTGWVISEDADRLLLAASHAEDWSLVGEIIAIPKPMIRTRWHPSADPSADNDAVPA